MAASPGPRGARLELVERLNARRAEIEAMVKIRVFAVEDSALVDPTYAEGLEDAVARALDYAIAVLEGQEPRAEAIPPQLIAQARVAARSGIGLDTVLRRYFAGYTSLCDYLLEEVSNGEDASLSSELQRSLRAVATLFDQIVVAIADSYREETQHRLRTVEHRRAQRVKALLAGEPVDAQDLGYELDLWHLGVVAIGPEAPRALRKLAAAADRRLLLVCPGGEATWGWLGGRRRMEAEELAATAADKESAGIPLAIGEPGRGIAGWRLTHHQAEAVLPVAMRGQAKVVSYSQAALLASVLKDEMLARSLSELYLSPLAQGRDGGEALRKTLRAYFSSGRNVASTAAALGASRQTVTSRLNTVEERVGQSLESCGTELETALRLWDLD